jgi:hypothetical protein
MKNWILIFLFWIMGTAGFSQGLPFPSGSAIFQRTNLEIRWEAPKRPWPKTLWTYQVAMTEFSPTVISYLINLGGFSGADKWYSTTNGVSYSRSGMDLRISCAEGEIDFERKERIFSSTNLAEDVPAMSQLYGLTTNLMPKLGINGADIPKTKGGRFQMNFYEPLSGFPGSGPGGGFLTNTEMRIASFGRLLDGVKCDQIVGSCTIGFGEHSQIRYLRLFWRNVKRDKLYPAATPKQIVQRIREGKAILPKWYYQMGDEIPIDWPAVRKITIKTAEAHYWGELFLGEREHRPIFPSLVVPYARLHAIVDTGTTNIEMEIDCPIIDETK